MGPCRVFPGDYEQISATGTPASPTQRETAFLLLFVFSLRRNVEGSAGLLVIRTWRNNRELVDVTHNGTTAVPPDSGQSQVHLSASALRRYESVRNARCTRLRVLRCLIEG